MAAEEERGGYFDTLVTPPPPGLTMGDDGDFYWSGNKTDLCYTDASGASWCGAKDECAGKGLLLPIFLEVTWPREARAVMYFLGLVYSFLGVSIVADIFMCAIEKITSKTKKIHVSASQERYVRKRTPIDMPCRSGS